MKTEFIDTRANVATGEIKTGNFLQKPGVKSGFLFIKKGLGNFQERRKPEMSSEKSQTI